MTLKPQTIVSRLEAFRQRYPKIAAEPFTAQTFAQATSIPVGTASATLSQGVRAGLLTYEHTRPRRYALKPPSAPAPRADIDSLLSIVAEIDAKGVKRTTIAPLLTWAANALLTA